jgi:phenylpropionate dioxygenase-like ring-hydroxylating dioxygenase large terminal subunit
VHRFPIRETYFEPSRDRVARLAPFPVLPSALLKKGQIVAETQPGGNTSILVHRDRRTGTVKAFRNQCRHRGAQLLPIGAEHRQKIGAVLTCPYHAWTYDIATGNLRGVPGEKEGFPCLEKKDHSLAQLSCVERGGIIWVGGDDFQDKSGWSLDEIDAELHDLLPSAGDNNEDLMIGYREWTLEANWQLLVETFLEAYHVSALHKDTLGLVAHSNVMVTDILDDRSFRMTVPLKNFETEYDGDDTAAPPATTDPSTSTAPSPSSEPFFSQTTTTYFLFPHTAVSIFKRFVVVLSIVPTSTSSKNDGEESSCSSTSSRVRAWGIRQHNDDDQQLAHRDFESVILGIEEDWSCAEAIQRGMNSSSSSSDNNNSLTSLTYGRFEGANVRFLQNVGMAADELSPRYDS